MSEEKTLSATAQKVLDQVEKLTIIELADLVEAMEEKFGVSAAAPVAAAGAEGGESGEEEKSSFNVELKDAGSSKIAVIKLIREITGLGLGEAKGIADNGGTIKENADKAEAEEMKTKFEEAGATVELA